MHVLSRLFVAIPLVVLCGCASVSPFGARRSTFYVAPQGMDTNSGSRWRPFATLQRARDAVRESRMPPGRSSSARVRVRRGVYELTEGLPLGPEDSGREGSPTVYSAHGRGRVVLLGGKRVAGASLTAVTEPGVIERLDLGAQIEASVVNLHALGIPTAGRLNLNVFNEGSDDCREAMGGTDVVASTYRAVDALEELDEPGEWYVDSMHGKLYLWALPAPVGSEVLVRTGTEPLITIQNAAWIEIRGFVLDGALRDGIRILGGHDNTVSECSTVTPAGCPARVLSGERHRIIPRCP